MQSKSHREPTQDDLLMVAEMAAFSFGSAVTDNSKIRAMLPEAVRCLKYHIYREAELGTTARSIKNVHNLISERFQENVKGMAKRETFRMFFEAAYLLLVLKSGVFDSLLLLNADDLLRSYPEFSSLPDIEVDKLLHFRNCMVVALTYIPAEKNRDYLLDLVTRLSEGCACRYIPGSGATEATMNRLAIYRREGQVEKKKRPPRRSELFKQMQMQLMSPPSAKASAIVGPIDEEPIASSAGLFPMPTVQPSKHCLRIDGFPAMIVGLKRSRSVESDAMSGCASSDFSAYSRKMQRVLASDEEVLASPSPPNVSESVWESIRNSGPIQELFDFDAHNSFSDQGVPASVAVAADDMCQLDDIDFLLHCLSEGGASSNGSSQLW